MKSKDRKRLLRAQNRRRGKARKPRDPRNKHHVFCRSTHPELRNESWNIVIVNEHMHDLYHQLFKNRSPREIIAFLSKTFWNGHLDPPDKRKETEDG